MNSTIMKISLLAKNDDSFCKTKLTGIFRVALKAISWASGVELNYTRRGNVFITFTNVFLNFCHVFTFLTFLIFIWTFLHLRRTWRQFRCHATCCDHDDGGPPAPRWHDADCGTLHRRRPSPTSPWRATGHPPPSCTLPNDDDELSCWSPLLQSPQHADDLFAAMQRLRTMARFVGRGDSAHAPKFVKFIRIINWKFINSKVKSNAYPNQSWGVLA